MATNSHTHPPADHRLTVDIPDRIFDIDAAIVAEFNDRIRNDPAGLVISVRDAYAGRVPYVYNKYLLSLMDCFMEARFESKSFGIDMPLPLWKPVVAAGLAELWQEMACAPDFFAEYPHFVELTLVGLSQMIMIITDPRYGAPSPASRRTLLRNAPSMFRSFWEHRELIPHTGTPGVGLGYDTAIYELISQAVNGFMTLYEKAGVDPISPKTFIPHIGLRCWYKLEGNKFAQGGLLALAFLLSYSTHASIRASESAATFIQEAGIDEYGAGNLLERFIRDVKSTSIPWNHLHPTLGILSKLTIYCPTLIPLIGQYDLQRTFSDVLVRGQLYPYVKEVWGVWVECSVFLKHHADRMRSEIRSGSLTALSTLPGEGMVRLLGCGFQHFVGRQSTAPTDLRFYEGPTLPMIALVQKCKEKPGQHSNDLLRDIERGVHAIWYPTLRLLRTEQQRPSTGLGKTLPGLIELWTNLGAEFSLKELRERDRYEREGLRHCAWKLCRYHIEKPESALSACQGCGEARYCGRTCQTKFAVEIVVFRAEKWLTDLLVFCDRDWKQGGHKAKCRRLKS